jgi:hypothetical protein
MKGSPRPAAAAATPKELPGVRALREAPPPRPAAGAVWALAVFCAVAAPPALVGAGLWLRLAGGPNAPVALWLAACGFFFAGLALSLRLRPLPPRLVLPVRARRRRSHRGTPQEIPMRPLFEDTLETEVPGLRPDMSRAELLEHLAKLREQGDLSNTEWLRAQRALLGDQP